MNQVEVLRKVLRDSLVRHEGHVALDRLARLVASCQRRDMATEAYIRVRKKDGSFAQVVREVQDANIEYHDALSDVLGEE